MTILSCYIVDDEPLALSLVESYVNKTPFLKLKGKFSSALACSAAIQAEVPDVIFLDIQMAELSGMEFAKVVPEKTRIIFTTAFQQYAIDSYRVNALDYLLKPFSYAEFLQAANKALKWFQLEEKASGNKTSSANSDCIFVKTNYQLLQVELNKIQYIEGLKDYLKIYVEGYTQSIVTHITMKAMEEMLPENDFIRVHRSFIVRKDKIRIIDRNRIIFGKIHIPVSDTYKEAFDKFLEGKLL